MRIFSRLAPIVLPLLGACSSNSKTISHQLFGVSHHSTEPKGTLAVSDDRRYTFITDSADQNKDGILAPDAFETLKVRASPSSLATLVAHGADDAVDVDASDYCFGHENGYVVTFKSGTSCFVVSEVTDENDRATLDYLVALFIDKATEVQ